MAHNLQEKEEKDCLKEVTQVSLLHLSLHFILPALDNSNYNINDRKANHSWFYEDQASCYWLRLILLFCALPTAVPYRDISGWASIKES